MSRLTGGLANTVCTRMYCIFVEKACTDEQVAQLQMQLAAYVATIDDKEAMGLGGFPDDKVLPQKSPIIPLNEILFLGGILNLENERDQPLTFI